MVQREFIAQLTSLSCVGYIDDDGLKIKTLCHSKMKEGAVRRCYFDLRSIPSTSSVARTSFKPVVARNTLIRGLTIRGCWEGQHFSYRLICTFGRNELRPAGLEITTTDTSNAN